MGENKLDEGDSGYVNMMNSKGRLNSKNSDTNAGFIEGEGKSKHLEMNVDTFDQSKNDKHVKRVIEHGESNNQITRLSSSSSSESSLNDVFELETADSESKSFRSASKDEQSYVSSHRSSLSEVDSNSSAPATSSTCVPPPTVSPPVQMMDPSGGYDPNRIPSSVFARNNTSPMEWSAASNDSLFSIHLANNSFSRDHVMFDDLYKSGELTKSGELRSQPSFVIPEAIETEEEIVNMEDLETNKMLDKTFESGDKSNEEEKQNKAKSLHPDMIRNSRNVSVRSHFSRTGTNSFAFPILIEAEGFGSRKADVSTRHSEEEPYVPPKEDASKRSPYSTANHRNWFWCFSWSSCWTPCKCRHCC
ncbi:hypothetical protein QN277_004047 [Acacia crassicarpa]|uniref:Uncharacterized protein n=1 Tax=Acacia crassicarpa TaxID=499986 RepID=A0AAE1IZK9_9FABA|nr:hypothetical protein QN277_004047 [Acacia crassicarpa]